MVLESDEGPFDPLPWNVTVSFARRTPSEDAVSAISSETTCAEGGGERGERAGEEPAATAVATRSRVRTSMGAQRTGERLSLIGMTGPQAVMLIYPAMR